MSGVITIRCLIPECHGLLVARSVPAMVAWEAKHKTECPVPEPKPLADVRKKLYDLEECDDPDYVDWTHRIDTEVMPLITVAAHLMVSDAQTTTGET